MSSFKSSENIQKKEGEPDRFVSDNQSSSVTLNELAMKARKKYCNFECIVILKLCMCSNNFVNKLQTCFQLINFV